MVTRFFIIGFLLLPFFTLGCATMMNDTCPGPTDDSIFVFGAKEKSFGYEEAIWLIEADGKKVPVKIKEK